MATPSNSHTAPRETILLATVGISPAVLTETAWALAHPRETGEEAVLPDEVIVLSTLRGAREVEAQLLGPDGGWARMLSEMEREGLPVEGKLAFGRASIHVLERGKEYLEDIRTGPENEATADFFLRTIRGITENPRTRLFASIAGGRKTMGALLLSCMSLLGRDQDRVLHVLVNEPYDSRLDPPFLFPSPRATHKWRNPATGRTETLRASGACLALVDLPFVKMRGWYQDKFRELPPGYGDLVRAAQSSAPAATTRKPLLRFDFRDGALFADGERIKLSPAEFLSLAVDLLVAPSDLGAALVALRSRVGGDFGWLGDFAAGTAGGCKFSVKSSAKADLTRARSSLRGKLRAIPSLAPHAWTLVPRGTGHGTWPKARISADIPAFRKMTGPW